MLSRQIETKVDWDSISELPYFGLDDIALKKGHKDFVAIVSTRFNGTVQILAVLSDRKKATIKALLKSIPQNIKETVKTVCSDMYDGHVNAVKEVFGTKVKVVIDRFHVAKSYRSCIDSLRKQELKHLKRELNEADYAKLKGAMWALRKNNDNLSTKDRQILDALFEYSPNIKRAYDLHFLWPGITEPYLKCLPLLPVKSVQIADTLTPIIVKANRAFIAVVVAMLIMLTEMPVWLLKNEQLSYY